MTQNGKKLYTNLIMKKFWDNIDKSGDCWEWTAGKQNHGYGKLRLPRGEQVYAHRYSWELHNGIIPNGMHVLHKCDNPSCVNPSHLFLGTHKDNMIDCGNKGRRNQAKGSDSPKSVINKQERKDIKKLTSFGNLPHWVIASMYEVSPATVSRIALT